MEIILIWKIWNHIILFFVSGFDEIKICYPTTSVKMASKTNSVFALDCEMVGVGGEGQYSTKLLKKGIVKHMKIMYPTWEAFYICDLIFILDGICWIFFFFEIAQSSSYGIEYKKIF